MEKKYMRFLIFITALVVGLVIGMMINPKAAHSESHTLCGPRENLVPNLKKRADEELAYIGLATNSQMLEVFTSPAGSFTVVMSQPSGRSCVVVIGEGWQAVKRRPIGDPT